MVKFLDWLIIYDDQVLGLGNAWTFMVIVLDAALENVIVLKVCNYM